MRSRCTNPNVESYPRYGGRGIKVCERWESFENFLADMGQRPDGNYSIERINGDGHYEPDNCRWATNKEQQNNIVTNHWIEHKGERRTITDWASIVGISPEGLYGRILAGYEGEELFRPSGVGGRHKVECLTLRKGTTEVYLFQNIAQLCKELGKDIQRNHRTVSRQLREKNKYEDNNFVVVRNDSKGKELIDSTLKNLKIKG